MSDERPGRGRFDSFFFGPIDGARPWILEKLLFLVVAFDCWLDLLPHGGRYGIGGFNVAHFRVLDVLLPRPNAALYGGVITAAGLLAFVSAFTRPHRGLRALVALLYTYAWTMSMLDSYQHHYLLTWVLGYTVLFPSSTAQQLFPAERDADFPRGVRVGAALVFGALAWALLLVAGRDAYLFASPEAVAERVALAERLGRDPASVVALGPTMTWLRAHRESLTRKLITGATLLGLLLSLLPDDSGAGARAGEDASSRKERARRRSVAQRREAGRATSAPAYVLLSVTAGLVYFFTAITKLNADWRDGAALRRIARSETYHGLEVWATQGDGLPLVGRLGVEEFWKSLAHGAILIQFVSFTAFVLAARLDRFRGKPAWVISVLGLAPLSFHIGAEHLDISIGWFSYYMMLIIVLVFAPRRLLLPFAAAIAIPSRRTAHFLELQLVRPGTQLFLVGFAVLALAALGQLTDLPGTRAGAIFVGLVLVAYAVRARRGPVLDQEREQRSLGHMALAALLAGTTMLGVITPSEVRWDYYRFVGGEHRRRGEWAEALEAYEKATHYAPLGESRQARADEMRRRLERESGAD